MTTEPGVSRSGRTPSGGETPAGSGGLAIHQQHFSRPATRQAAVLLRWRAAPSTTRGRRCKQTPATRVASSHPHERVRYTESVMDHPEAEPAGLARQYGGSGEIPTLGGSVRMS